MKQRTSSIDWPIHCTSTPIIHHVGETHGKAQHSTDVICAMPQSLWIVWTSCTPTGKVPSSCWVSPELQHLAQKTHAPATQHNMIGWLMVDSPIPNMFLKCSFKGMTLKTCQTSKQPSSYRESRQGSKQKASGQKATRICHDCAMKFLGMILEVSDWNWGVFSMNFSKVLARQDHNLLAVTLTRTQ